MYVCGYGKRAYTKDNTKNKQKNDNIDNIGAAAEAASREHPATERF